jgi:cytochrome P450 family 142 subfamily A polypeptide 1
MNTTARTPLTDDDRLVVDLLDPEFYQRDPHDVWTWMRANEPVYRDHRNGLWAITRHGDIMQVERMSSVFVSGQGYRAIWSREENNMIALDDPRHRQQRMLVQGEFTSKAVAARREQTVALITEVIDAALESGASGAGRMEVVQELAAQVPARTTARLLGFPEESWPDIKSWSERLMRIDMRERDGDTFVEFIDANLEFAGALAEISAERSACPAHDLISIWNHAEIDGRPLSEETIVHEVGLFISGGAETTRTAISHGLRVFADHPDQWEAMAADPSLVPGAVEEVLRWVTPLNNMFRRAVVDAEVGGQQIKRGDRIIMIYPSANRDEAVFDEPFRFDITRARNPHLAFGFGTHLCLGTHQARMTLTEVFGQLAQRITNLRVISEPEIESNIFARAVERFEVGFDLR